MSRSVCLAAWVGLLLEENKNGLTTGLHLGEVLTILEIVEIRASMS
jgi:hypothetical protein